MFPGSCFLLVCLLDLIGLLIVVFDCEWAYCSDWFAVCGLLVAWYVWFWVFVICVRLWMLFSLNGSLVWMFWLWMFWYCGGFG